MGEFANTIRRQAAQTLRTRFQHDPGHPADPVLELMGLLLEDGAGGFLLLPDTPVTTEQWITWNRLVQNQPRAVVRVLTRELERERVVLPRDKEAMRTWSAQLLLSTLDRMGML
jgi:hypothetical protein